MHPMENRAIHPLMDGSEAKVSNEPPNMITPKTIKSVPTDRSLYDFTNFHDNPPAKNHNTIKGSDPVNNSSISTPDI